MKPFVNLLSAFILAMALMPVAHAAEEKPSLFTLPPEAFTPPPKVTSAVVTLTPRPAPLVDVSINALELVVAKAFGQRRKMLRSALKGLNVPADKLLEIAGIDGTLRAEQLDVATLCRLAKAYQESGQL